MTRLPHFRNWLSRMTARVRLALAARRKMTPHDVGLGLAIGVFLGCAPLLPLQTAWALGAAHLLRASKAAAFLGASLSNPVTLAPLLAVYYRVGAWLAPGLSGRAWPDLSFQDGWRLFAMGWDALATLTIGGAAVGLPAGVAAYVLGRRAAESWALRRTKRKARREAGPGNAQGPSR